ncbi:DUF6886 family protein [Paenibacillus azoreducens]|uniref:Uncharacterized protein n=1 Tax=Paenibacillus azoreducens TaxID=116718 RepID=A0A920CUV4_9BACL|nr:DUF6886 family protein [Paenibacillus azoreducens]GIO50739.1 hypothetical protein J34TS1_55040 [Paenibacillus azoreducens]
MKLYHFSEEARIEVFHPRVKANRTDMSPVVWAIDEEHQFTFFVPRNCPRIVYTRHEGMSEEDEIRFFGHTSADIVMTMETRWYNKMIETPLYRYELPPESFECFDEIAGYYISREMVEPVGKTEIRDSLQRLLSLGIDFRFTPDLHPLKDAILRSSLKDFGIHRFEYAIGAAEF